MHNKVPPHPAADFQFELELGAPIQCHSILRAEQNSGKVAVRDEENLDKAMLHEEHMPDEVPTGVSRRRLSWVDQKTSAKLESVRVFEDEAAVYDGDDSDEELAEVGQDDENPEKKFLIDPEEETLNDVFDDYESEEDEEEEQSPKRTYERKRKAEDISAAKKEESDEDATENWDEDDEENLLIDDGENEEVEVKKKKQRRSAAEIRREKMEMEMAKMEEYERLRKLLDETDDVHEQYDILMKMTLGDKAPKFEVKPTNMEEFAKELELDLEKNAEFYEERQRQSFALIDGNRFKGGKRTKADLDREFAIVLGLSEEEDDSEDKNEKKGEMETFEDMPDVDDLIHEDPKSPSHIADQLEKKSRVEVPLKENKKEERKKKSKRGYTKGAPKNDEKVARTEEEVIAEIGKKKAESLEKATRMKEMKREEKERKRIEKEKKKETEERVKEEKKREKKEDWMDLVERAPRTRAEASRRTKALLKLGKRVMLELMNEDGYEDEGRKKMKKVQYEEEETDNESVEKEESEVEVEEVEKPKQMRRTRGTRTNPVAYLRRAKKEAADDEVGPDCGNYIANPNDIRGTKYCQSEWDSDYEEDDEDASSSPFLWRSDKEDEMMIDGAMGPANFDPDEIMKRRLNDATEFSEGITAEYHAMIKQLDGMQLNLFADSTVRRFDPGVVHTIDSSITVCMWPISALPKPEDKRLMKDLHVWPGEGATPFGRRGPSEKVTPFVRIRPESIKRDKKASMEIDKIATGEVVTVTKDDIMRNLEELLQSKLDGTKKWTPLPSARNPFDVPEISTRKLPTEPREDEPVSSYVQKVDVISLPLDNVNKKKMKKKTIKEALMEFMEKPDAATTKVKDIYKNDQEGDGDDDDGYKFEWNEMGEIMDNPMRDNLIGEDPFGAHSYEGTDFGVVDEVAEEDESAMMDIETEEETQIGEAFSFMANHLDI